MIKSMTGFGSAIRSNGKSSIRFEIRCLNSKGMDVYLHTNTFLGEDDIAIRQHIENKLKRGRADVYLQINSTDILPLALHGDVLKKYFEEIQKIGKDIQADMQGVFAALIRMEGVVEKNTFSMDEPLRQLIYVTLNEALQKTEEFRIREGEKLHVFFLERLELIERSFDEIIKRVPSRMLKIKEKIRKQIQDLSVETDENRFEQELIYYAEKLDVQEEADRFKMHIQHLRDAMNEDMPGKKMVFFCQELHREINTLSNKAMDAGIQKYAVGIKEEIEKFREQAMNVI
jgi:uncharacterized protein (TIGR00255 family)